MLDLLLVNPSNQVEQFAKLSDLATIAQPLGIAMIAAFVRQHGIKVDIVDAEAYGWGAERTVEEIESHDPRLVGLSAFTTKMTAAGKVLSLLKAKRPDIKTVIGGHHCSAIPEQTLLEECADYVIQGEGFYPILELAKTLRDRKKPHSIQGLWYIESGHIVPSIRAHGPDNLDDLPFAAWDLLPMERYRAHHWQAWDYGLDTSGYAVIFSSLGCPFSCDYCTVNVVYGRRRVRFRSPQKVVDEVRLLHNIYGVTHFELIDDTFTANKEKAAALCQALADSGLGTKINIWCFARTDRVEPELMRLMKKAGINWVFMGFEAGNDQVLAGVHKRQTVEQIKKANKIVHDAGIHIGGNFLFGLPDDTHETMRDTLELAKELNPEYANFFLLMTYPGTKLRELAIEKGYPLPERWGQYGFFAPDALPMRNEHLTGEEILAFRDAAFKEYYHRQEYYDMIKKVFGLETLKFIQTKVLTKNIKRTRLP